MLPRTLDEAKREIAKRWLKLEKLGSDLGISNLAFGIPAHDQEEEPIRLERKKIDRYILSLYSLPWLRGYFESWMVDIKFGNENPFRDKESESSESESSESLDEKVSALIEDPKGFSERTGGPIIREVEKFLNERGFSITDRGGSCNGGHIGFPCSDLKLGEIIFLLNIHFKKAIDAGFMSAVIAWFKPNIPDFFQDNQIREWILKDM